MQKEEKEAQKDVEKEEKEVFDKNQGWDDSEGDFKPFCVDY